jgi:thiol:disulfide interchange protein DsbA
VNRREFIVALGAGTVCATVPALASNDMPELPLVRVGPFSTERLKVFEFFLFSCYFCQDHHDTIASWGASIPAPVQFEPVPVIVDFESFTAARAFYAVKKAAPERLNQYMRAAFDGARRGVGNPAAQEILRGAGIPQKAFDLAWRSQAIKEPLTRALDLTTRYKVEATPSIAIGGRTVVHADLVGGDYGVMIRLASGFVSRVLEGRNAI